MALLSEVNRALVGIVRTALSGIGLTPRVGSEFPSQDALVQIVSAGSTAVSIFHKLTGYSDTCMRYEHSESSVSTGISTELSDPSLAPGQSVSLTLGYADDSDAVKVDDAVTLQAMNPDLNNSALGLAEAGDTLITLAAKLAAQVNVIFEGYISATASGAVVTVTNTSESGFYLASHCGNIVTVKVAVKEAYRSMQIMIWTPDLATKKACFDCLEPMFGDLDDAEGFTLPTGEVVMFKLNGAHPGNADVDKDVYKDDFLVTLRHPIDRIIVKYPILAPISNVKL